MRPPLKTRNPSNIPSNLPSPFHTTQGRSRLLSDVPLPSSKKKGNSREVFSCLSSHPRPRDEVIYIRRQNRVENYSRVVRAILEKNFGMDVNPPIPDPLKGSRGKDTSSRVHLLGRDVCDALKVLAVSEYVARETQEEERLTGRMKERTLKRETIFEPKHPGLIRVTLQWVRRETSRGSTMGENCGRTDTRMRHLEDGKKGASKRKRDHL